MKGAKICWMKSVFRKADLAKNKVKSTKRARDGVFKLCRKIAQKHRIC